jgi:hypothetical protein
MREAKRHHFRAIISYSNLNFLLLKWQPRVNIRELLEKIKKIDRVYLWTFSRKSFFYTI